MRGDKVFLFWSKYDPNTDTTIDKWRDREISLNPSHILSLQSHLKFGHQVFLYTYQPITYGIPKDVIVMDAGSVYSSQDAYSALQRGHSIAHVSDIVRLTMAATSKGILMDMDAIIVNELPNLDGYFCTMPAKATGGVAPKWGKAHPPFLVHDGSWDGKALSAFPTKVNTAMAKPILKLAERIEKQLSEPPRTGSKAWNYILWTIKDIARSIPDSTVYPPIKTCPVPSWLGPGKCYTVESPTRLTGTETVFGYTMPSIEQIFEESFIVQHFFESAFQGFNQDKSSAAFWYDIPHDSLLGLIASRTVGENWKTLLPSLARTVTHA